MNQLRDINGLPDIHKINRDRIVLIYIMNNLIEFQKIRCLASKISEAATQLTKIVEKICEKIDSLEGLLDSEKGILNRLRAYIGSQ